MHLIIGGAYMGKLHFAKEYFGFAQEQVWDCAEGEPDFSAKCIRHLEEYVFRCTLRQEDPVAFFRENRERWEHCVLICRDISGGIVPMDEKQRLWRAKTGQLCQYLTKEAETVSRVFCGLEQRLK